MKPWAVVLAVVLALCGRAGAATEPQPVPPADGHDYIVLAVDNPLHRLPQRAGSSLPYSGAPRYVQGSEASDVLASIEREHRLQPVAAWPIAALGWHCVVYGVPQGVERDALIRTLAADNRVRLVQPLQDFTTLGAVAEAPANATTRAPVAYDDPYVDLQRGFVQTAAARAHRLSTGHGVTVAIVDTGVDLQHPELRGRVVAHQDAVAPASADTTEQEAHGTAVAGVIAAAANNQQGIVGIAPGVQLNVYRACWYLPAGSGAHCNSFTLAKALAAALDSDARIVNLSLGGPSDPLLEALLHKLLDQRRVVVGALPPSGRREGFPSGVPGVVVVGIAGEQAHGAGVLSAPGRDVLTPTPGGRYDFSSGSSIATAHVSGIAALLLALDPRLDGAAVQQLLEETTPTSPGAAVNADTAVAALVQRIHLASAR